MSQDHHAGSGRDPGRRGAGADPASGESDADLGEPGGLRPAHGTPEGGGARGGPARGTHRRSAGDCGHPAAGRCAARGDRHDRNVDRADRKGDRPVRLSRAHRRFLAVPPRGTRRAEDRILDAGDGDLRPAHTGSSRRKRRDRGARPPGDQGGGLRRAGDALHRPAQEAQRPRPRGDRRGARRAGGALRRPRRRTCSSGRRSSRS